jgi:hypothetical protein
MPTQKEILDRLRGINNTKRVTVEGNVMKVNFRKPEPQSQLNGQLGLTTQDVAASLGIEAKTVRRDLTERDSLERIKACGFKAVPFGTLHPINGSEYTDFVLDVNAAKWFIAKYNNKVADQYLAYLIKVESDAVADGVTTHTDPTDLTSKLLDPVFLAKAFANAAAAIEKANNERDEAIKTKTLIGSTAQAKAMQTASVATRKLRLVESEKAELETKLSISKIGSEQIHRLDIAFAERLAELGLPKRCRGKMIRLFKNRFGLTSTMTYKDLPVCDLKDALEFIKIIVIEE